MDMEFNKANFVETFEILSGLRLMIDLFTVKKWIIIWICSEYCGNCYLYSSITGAINKVMVVMQYLSRKSPL